MNWPFMAAAAHRTGVEKEVAEFNRRLKIGDEVIYCPPRETPQRLATRTAAQVLAGHTPVVWLAGKSGCVRLRYCHPAPAASPGTLRAERVGA